jgi:hypothetical protein
MSISDYASTAGGNTALFPESMAPAGVNDGARQVQADLRNAFNDLGWFNYGSGTGTPAYTYVSSTSFSVLGNLTTVYHTSRRVRAVGSSTGTIYGTIASSSHNAGVTTVVCVWDSGSLSNETLVISIGLPRAGNATPTANTTQVAAGTDAGVFLTPEKVAAVTSKAADGYIRYPGGIILQWGDGQTDGSGVATVSLPFGVTTINQPVVQAINGQHTNIVVTANGVNNFTILSTDAAGAAKASVFFSWLGIGY